MLSITFKLQKGKLTPFIESSASPLYFYDLRVYLGIYIQIILLYKALDQKHRLNPSFLVSTLLCYMLMENVKINQFKTHAFVLVHMYVINAIVNGHMGSRNSFDKAVE